MFTILKNFKEIVSLRIKIWTEDNGTEDIVYDNGVQRAIGDGSIIVHKK